MRSHEARRKHPRRPRLLAAGLTAGATLAATVLATSTGTAAATTAAAHATSTAATTTVTPSAQTLAAASADALVAGRPAFLHAGAEDQFVRQSVISSTSAQYVPYLRTYSGIPVVGGDFVVVTDGAGHVLADSVAQDHPIGTLSTTPALSSAKAASVAATQLKSVTRIEGTKLVVYALGAAPAALAWETTLDGTGPEATAG